MRVSLTFLLERGRPLSPLPLQWCVVWAWLASGLRLGSTKEGEARALSGEAPLWFGAGCRGPGAGPLRVEERFPLGAVQCSHCVSGVMGLGDRPLLSDRTAASLSIQPAKLCPCPSLAAWQEFAEVTRLRFSLSEVWCKRSVTCHFVIVQPSLKQPDSTLPF